MRQPCGCPLRQLQGPSSVFSIPLPQKRDCCQLAASDCVHLCCKLCLKLLLPACSPSSCCGRRLLPSIAAELALGTTTAASWKMLPRFRFLCRCLPTCCDACLQRRSRPAQKPHGSGCLWNLRGGFETAVPAFHRRRIRHIHRLPPLTPAYHHIVDEIARAGLTPSFSAVLVECSKRSVQGCD